MTSAQAKLLKTLPPEAARVQVRDNIGKTRYKKPEEVLDTDQILLDQNGCVIFMAGAPGRKKKPDLRPVSPKIEERLRAKKEYLDDDELYDIIRKNPESGVVLDCVMGGLAEEAASLGFERQEAERQGESTSQISMRRINALKSVGESWIKRKEQIISAGVDLESKAFEKLFLYIAETFKESVEDVMHARPEMVETLFAHFSKKTKGDSWVKEATKRMSED